MTTTNDRSQPNPLITNPYVTNLYANNPYVPSYMSNGAMSSVGGSSINLDKTSNAKVGGSKTTRGGYDAARFYPVDDTGNSSGGPTIYCTFNPNKYSISVTNNFRTKGVDKNQNLNIEADENSVQGRELSIGEIWFDASDIPNGMGDVRQMTGLLMELAQMKDENWQPPEEEEEGGGGGAELKPPPVKVAFHWGTFQFLGIIKSLTIEYVLFNKDGTPLRAKANVKLTEFKQEDTQPNQDASSASGPNEKEWTVTAGERLEHIAANIYGDESRWRSIAESNNILDPASLRPGTILTIPTQ